MEREGGAVWRRGAGECLREREREGEGLGGTVIKRQQELE